ncbi:protein mono-ADP-ribosyltransferase PARP14-like, partial [Ruditapes philippinarum]|uniref:protein mono-ADP-ribosyltransferase PARP14-like n=1 Tax=Ruditapes philippinarum TaxID=129788 RepID=UPI00295A8588
ADILVNTIDRMGDFDKGAISKSLLKKAGNEGHKLQAEIRKFKCPLDSLKVYKTGAYLQGCKFIFHGLLEYYVANGTSQKKLKKFVLDCLKEAESCNCTTIAFPALGAGKLDYPLYEVKAAMFDAVEEFNMSCSGGTSLQDVKFVLFEYEAFQDFKAEQNKR